MEKLESNPFEGEKMSVSVDKMSNSDIDGVLSLLQESLLPDKISDSEREKLMMKGFIVYPVDKNNLSEVIADEENHISLVARGNNNNMLGYVLAYDLNIWRRHKAGWDARIDAPDEIKSLLTDNKVLYLRHIVAKKEHEGIGVKLEYKLFKEAKRKKFEYIIGEILKKPVPNNISLRFHEGLEFRQVGTMQYDDNTLWTLVLKDLREKSK